MSDLESLGDSSKRKVTLIDEDITMNKTVVKKPSGLLLFNRRKYSDYNERERYYVLLT